MGASVGKSLTISGIEVTLLKQVGSGGFADIFLASRKGDSKPRYALKRMYAQKGDAEKSRVCKWEYQVNQRMIKHPNLVSCVGAQCVEHSSGDQEYLLLLEYMEGGTLLDWIQSSEHAKKQSADVVYIFRQLVDGLSVLHAHCPPIRHQDLKPENFLAVSPDGKGEWRLCDFGSSTIENWTVKTNAERVYVGGMLEKTTTPSYRAPVSRFAIFQRAPRSLARSPWICCRSLIALLTLFPRSSLLFCSFRRCAISIPGAKSTNPPTAGHWVSLSTP